MGRDDEERPSREVSYRRREPERTLLYRLVAGEIDALREALAAASPYGTGLPSHVEKELGGYLHNSEESLSLDVLARRCGLSGSRLSRLFHEQIGVTIPQFRNRLRINRFLQLYGTGQRHTLTEAAFAADVQSYSQFQRAFRQVMHMSPADYRPAK